MYRSTKYLLFLLLIGFGTINLYSQKDSTKVKIDDNQKGVIKSNNQLKATNIKITPPSTIDLNIDKKLNSDAIQKNLEQNKATAATKNFLMENLPEDNDIIGKKYWNNKDVTHKKLESNLSLGTISSSSKTVKIECRDHSYVDGDRIRIYINEKVVSDNIGLKGNYYVVYLNLEEGYNRIDFQALNQGTSGPNTAELKVYDDKGNLISSKEWNLPTGYTATLGIIKK